MQHNTNYSETENLQKRHYELIASRYAAHYGDHWSQEYRRRFINRPMFKNIDLSNAVVLDAMCGSGETTAFLVGQGAKVTGVDISEEEIKEYEKRYPGCTSKCASILSSQLESDHYDCVVVVGGLHHLHPQVNDAITEIHRVLKVGGYFCFFEPHQGSLPNALRRLWYRMDSLFAENEEAIDVDSMKSDFSTRFRFITEAYKGNFAYLLVLNSLIFRMPLWMKGLYSRPLMILESIVEKIQGKRSSCFVVCQWQKVQ